VFFIETHAMTIETAAPPAPPPAQAPTRLTDRKREAILQAAITEFRANGFDATSMDKIAASAEVSKRTVYNHFPSKDDLFAAILLQLWESSAPMQDVAYQPEGDLRSQLQQLMQQKMRMLTDGNFIDLARVAIAATIHSPERAQAMVAKLGEREEGVVGWIRAAQQDGKLKPCDPQFAAHLLQGQLKSFAFWPQITMGKPALDPAMQQQVVRAAVDMFLGYFAR
jgi:TetR/AcrR family transcriptional regulator of autoinduction and epiphytic fitness